MNIELGSFSNGSTGNTTVLLNGSFTPTFIDLWIGPRTGHTETVSMSSKGFVDITNNFAAWQSNYSDGTGSQTVGGSGSATGSSCIQHYARNSGTLTKHIDIKYVSVASGQITLNLLTADSTYTIFFKAYG